MTGFGGCSASDYKLMRHICLLDHISSIDAASAEMPMIVSFSAHDSAELACPENS